MAKALWLALLLIPTLALADTPDIRQPVTDLAGLLSEHDRATVADQLVRLRQDTGVQMAVLVVGTTSREAIEDYAHRVATAWKGGQKGKDNGLLLVVAVNDRRMRLEVGYGLEAYLPDGVTRELLDAQGPRMRERDYAGALLDIIQGVSEHVPTMGADGPSWHPWSQEEVRDTFMALLCTALGAGLLMGVCVGPWRERLGRARPFVVAGLLAVPPTVAGLAIRGYHQPVRLFLLGYGAQLAVFFLGARAFSSGYKVLGRSLALGTFLGGAIAWLWHPYNSADLLPLLLIAALLSFNLALVMAFVMTALLHEWEVTRSYSSSDSFWSSLISALWDLFCGVFKGSSRDSSWEPSSSSSYSDSSSSSSSSSDSSSSSSSSSDSSWGGGGGDFGGGGSSSSWDG